MLYRFRICAAALVFLGATLIAGTAAAEPARLESEGVIHEVDFETHSVVIDALAYRVAIDAKVSIAGSYGALTMLEPGMRVRFEFDEYGPTERVITDIEEMADDEELVLN